MYKTFPLRKINMDKFIKLNNERTYFNDNNMDFFSIYNKSNFLQKFFIKKSVKLLEYKKDFIGYIWTESFDNDNHRINSMYLHSSVKTPELCKLLIDSTGLKGCMEYIASDSAENNEILRAIGFNKSYGTMELTHNLIYTEAPVLPEEVNFEVLRKGSQEYLRCNLQNIIFKNDSRIPLSIYDIYHDESQEYYIDEGAVFLKYKDIYIGYGQVINDNNKATIVNLGIIPEHRSKGYATILLYHLFNIAKSLGYKSTCLKVNSENIPALKLYEKAGFIKNNEVITWQIKNK